MIELRDELEPASNWPGPGYVFVDTHDDLIVEHCEGEPAGLKLAPYRRLGEGVPELVLTDVIREFSLLLDRGVGVEGWGEPLFVDIARAQALAEAVARALDGDLAGDDPDNPFQDDPDPDCPFPEEPADVAVRVARGGFLAASDRAIAVIQAADYFSELDGAELADAQAYSDNELIRHARTNGECLYLAGLEEWRRAVSAL